MTEPKKYWLTDGDSYAVATGVEERDRLIPLGWAETDEPAEGWVHIWHPEIEQPGRVPVTALPDLWEPRGWSVGPPPGSAHPAAAVKAEPAPAADPAETKSSKTAAGGTTAKKE